MAVKAAVTPLSTPRDHCSRLFCHCCGQFPLERLLYDLHIDIGVFGLQNSLRSVECRDDQTQHHLAVCRRDLLDVCLSDLGLLLQDIAHGTKGLKQESPILVVSAREPFLSLRLQGDEVVQEQLTLF